MSRFFTPNIHAVLTLGFFAVFLTLGSTPASATSIPPMESTTDSVTMDIVPALTGEISSKIIQTEAVTLSASVSEEELKAAKAAALAKSFVPLEKWHCGASDIDKSLSHQLAESDCPSRMYEANLCCLAHDLCYVEEDKTQEECDSAFCFCLERTVSEAARVRNHTVGGCSSFADSHCFIVQIFGAAAHRNAKASRSSTTTTSATTTVGTTSTTTVARTTTTTVPTTRPTTVTQASTTSTVATSTATKSPQSPAEIAQFITHNVSLQCFDYHLSSCVEDMHACVIAHNAENKKLLDQPRLHRLSHRIQQSIRAEAAADAASVCATQFCVCTAAAPSNDVAEERQSGANCGASVALMCHEFGGQAGDASKPQTQGAGLNVHFWSVNVQYLGRDMDLVTTFFGGFCALAAFFILAYLAMKIYGRRCGRGGNAEMFTVARPSDLVIGACQRRQKRDSKAGYNAFSDKKTSASSTDSGYHNHKHSTNNGGNNSSSCGKILKSAQQQLHIQPHLIPLNSSKAQLIMPDENSSASSPSINSNE